tara:strand:- start:8204 stop:9268 length:1065 start_codon:yes stop_codon:yes gene_type:complete
MADEAYINLAIRRQAILERLKSGEVSNFAVGIKKIEKLIRSAIFELEGEFGKLSRVKLNNLLALLQQDQGEIFKAATASFLERSADIAAVYMAQEILDLKNTVDVRGTKLNDFTKKDIFKKVIQRPLSTDGDLLQPWIKKFSDREISRVSNSIRLGHSQGLTNQEMVQKLVGTKARKFQDGLLQTTRRNAETVVRTSVQHVASAARQEVWEANPDVVKRYKFLATLDRTTSPICRTLDKQEFDFGQGPIPPVHPNCRSTTTPVLDPKFSFLSKGRTRSGEQGPVSADTTYYEWLKRQDKAAQSAVLGPKRAKLFQDGGLTAERFRALQFDKNFTPLTLDGMRKLEPEAFKKAGL